MKTYLAFLLIISTELTSFKLPRGKFFEVISNNFLVLHETPSLTKWDLRVKKVNNVRAFVGTVIYYVPFGNNVTVEAKLLKKQGGEYRYLPYRVPPTPFCDFVEKDDYIYPDLVKGSDFPADIANNCPLPTRNYTMYNATFGFENIPGITQIAQSGDYCCEVALYTAAKNISLFRLCVTVNNI